MLEGHQLCSTSSRLKEQEDSPPCLRCPVASWSLFLASTEELKNFLKLRARCLEKRGQPTAVLRLCSWHVMHALGRCNTQLPTDLHSTARQRLWSAVTHRRHSDVSHPGTYRIPGQAEGHLIKLRQPRHSRVLSKKAQILVLILLKHLGNK